MNSSNTIFQSLLVALLLLGSDAAYADTAGHVQFVNGDVQLTTAAGRTHSVQKGEAINEGDTLTSAKAASAQIKMQDGGFVAVRPDTRLKFDSFKFSGQEDGSERSFFSLFQGGFRAVTGLIGRINKPNYRITTPTSTIGIRGTDHETFVVVQGSELAAVAPAGAYNKVNLGETSITTDKGTIFVLPNQMGFAGAADQMPQLQPINTNIFTVAAEPAPQAGGGDQEGGEGKVRETAADDTAAEAAAAAAEEAAPPAVSPVTNIIQVAVTTSDGTDLTGGGIGGGEPPLPGTGGGTGGGEQPLSVVINPPAGNWTAWGQSTVGTAGSWQRGVLGTAVPLANTNFELDAGGNLVKVLHAGYSEKPLWNIAIATATSVYTDAMIAFSGGTVADYFALPDNSLVIGRWTGGTIDITDNLGVLPALVKPLGVTSVPWILGTTNTAVVYVQSLVGTTAYTLAGATLPTDSLGHVGTAPTATLSANFTNQTVNTSIAFTIFNQGMNISASAMPILPDNTNNGSLAFAARPENGNGPTITCAGAGCSGSGYLGRLVGIFKGTKAMSASLDYTLYPTAVAGAMVSDVIQGVMAFSTATAPTVGSGVAPSGPVAAYLQTDLAVAYATLDLGAVGPFGAGALISNNTFVAAPADVNNVLPNPSMVNRYAGNDAGSSVTYTLNGTTTVGEAPTTLANGIQFGRYDSTQGQMVVVGNTYTGLTPGSYLSGGAVKSHWIAGPAIDPVYLPEVLTGTATYTLAGGTVPTASMGAATLNSASLSVNFTQQLVAFNLNLTVGGAPWIASTTNAPLEIMYWNNAKSGFTALTAYSGWGTLTVTCPSCSVNAFSTVTGQLTGSGLNGAILSYLLGDGIGQTVAGVAAFTGTPQTAPPYRIVALATIDQNPSASIFPPGVIPYPITAMTGGYNNTGSVLTDASGNVTGFKSGQNFSKGGAMTIGIGTATPAGLGTDPISGISWGRWVGGSLSGTDLATGATSQYPHTAITGAALSSHWIASPALTGPVTLPVSGTFNYVLAGGTAPTDSLGGVGTLNSATLVANFTAQTVAVGINVTTPNAGNLVASGSGIPIEQKSFFGASTANTAGFAGATNPGLLTVTCPAGCGAAGAVGHVGGVFAGAGAIGAGVLYGLDKGGVLVNGVAAFHR